MEETTQDEGYLAEYRKQNNSELEPLFGEEAQEVIDDLVEVSPELRSFLQDLVKG
jgi:hypothetical protein